MQRKNIIGGQHDIDQNIWALSLVRKEGADHAYLILEGIDEKGERIIEDMHLVVKKGTNGRKGEVVSRSTLYHPTFKLEDIIEVSSDCSSYTWNVNSAQVQKLKELVQSEKQRADKNEINYVLFGDPVLSGIVGASLDQMRSTESKEALAKKSDNHSMDMLLRTGHNCGSWAIAMARALELQFRTSWLSFVAVYPAKEIQGAHDGDKGEPTTRPPGGCRMM